MQVKPFVLGRTPVLPTVTEVFGLPNWIEGIQPDVGQGVLVIREVAYRIVVSAELCPKMKIREMLQDYIRTRAFHPAEKDLAFTFEVVSGGKRTRPERRIATRCGRRTTLKTAVSEDTWNEVIRVSRPLRSQII
jgi:hypothetical protein